MPVIPSKAIKPDSGLFVRRNYLSLIFFSLLLLTGLFVYKDYGISWDEEFCRERAVVTTKYIITNFLPQFSGLVAHQNIPDLHQYQNRDYGVVFELPIFIIEKLLKFDFYSQNAFFFRHLSIFLVYFLGVFFFYKTVKQRFNSSNWALLGALLFVLSPRVFADAFYNSKDIVFMAACCIGMYTLLLFLKAPTYKSALLHALACAIAIDIRVLGMLLPALTLAFIVMKFPFEKAFKVRKLLSVTLFYCFLTGCFIILFWPLLWEDPVVNFLSAFTSMAKFRFTEPVFFLGKMFAPANLPWYYLPVWIVISTPVMYTVCFLFGLSLFTYDFIKYRLQVLKNESHKQDLLWILFFSGPLIAIWLFNSVVYDAWRQVFFIYPAFLLIGLSGLHKIITLGYFSRYRFHKTIVWGLSIGLVLSCVHTLYFMIKAHPHQNVYFSLISGETAAKNFERDYWGLSYKQALEFVLANDKSDTIKYYAAQVPGRMNQWILPAQDQKRLQLVPYQQATYFLTEYRWHPHPYPLTNEIFTIEIDKLKIMSVFKLK